MQPWLRFRLIVGICPLEERTPSADARQIAGNPQHVPVEKQANCALSTATRIILSAHGAIGNTDNYYRIWCCSEFWRMRQILLDYWSEIPYVWCQKYGKYTLKKIVFTGLLVRKTIYLKQKIQEIYSEEIGMCSNDINVGKKQCFG